MSNETKEMVWDVTKACFRLLAIIIIGNMLFGFLIFSACAYGVMVQGYPVGTCKDYVPNIMELLVGGMAVVIAFSGRSK